MFSKTAHPMKHLCLTQNTGLIIGSATLIRNIFLCCVYI